MSCSLQCHNWIFLRAFECLHSHLAKQALSNPSRYFSIALVESDGAQSVDATLRNMYSFDLHEMDPIS